MPPRRLVPLTAAAVVAAVIAALVTGAAGCDKTTHDNLDKWMNTEQGPRKLRAALVDGSIDPDLSAHAAENLLLIGEAEHVREALRALDDGRRARVLDKLAPRLWRVARVEGELTAPTPAQYAAKDLLFDLREHAAGPTRAAIDGYLIDWLTGGYYEGRAEFGRHGGAAIVRALGPAAAPKMIAAANAVVGAPPKEGGKRLKVGDQLLLGLAVTGDPEAVRYVIDVMGMERGDPTLRERALGALYVAFVEPPAAQFERADGAALVPHLAAIAQVLRDGASTNRMVNDAVALLAAAGPPHCLPPLIAMIGRPHDDPRYLWVGANNALRCGGPEAIAPVLAAIPESGSYEHQAFQGAISGEIARMTPRARVADEARGLLAHRSWVVRWAAVEVLGVVGGAEDAARLEALARDKAKLHGYWGAQGHLPAKERKPEPTLGNRAAELAGKLRS